MPPSTDQPDNDKTLEEIVAEVGVYSLDAFKFVQEGLSFAVQRVHGEGSDPETGRHISGQELCEGLREYALARWGLLAGTVLKRWGITATMDFGRIVFVMIEHGMLQKTDHDTIDDFRNVYDFRTAFESKYQIPSPTP
jgi:uncharacterized repeat protein (TIGR04138 family)